MQLSGQLADHFKGAMDFGEEDETMDATVALRTDDQLLPSSPGAIQRLWHLHLTELRGVPQWMERARIFDMLCCMVAMVRPE